MEVHRVVHTPLGKQQGNENDRSQARVPHRRTHCAADLQDWRWVLCRTADPVVRMAKRTVAVQEKVSTENTDQHMTHKKNIRALIGLENGEEHIVVMCSVSAANLTPTEFPSSGGLPVGEIARGVGAPRCSSSAPDAA